MKFLAQILADITGYPRAPIGAVTWNKSSITYNLFRVWELLAWRRCDMDGGNIRAEAATEVRFKERGIVEIHRYFYTKEAAIVHFESMVREFFKLPELKFRLVKVPQFALAGGGRMSPIFSYAVAFDVLTYSSGTGTARTWSHTVTGSNPAIFLGAMDNNALDENVFTGAKYAGVDMGTYVERVGISGLAKNLASYLWYQSACATGANNAEIDTSSSIRADCKTVSYSGVATGGVDAHANNQADSTSVTATVVVVAANCWVIGMDTGYNFYETKGGVLTANRGDVSGTWPLFADSGGTVSTGNNSVTWTNGSTDSIRVIGASIAPFGAATVRRRIFKHH